MLFTIAAGLVMLALLDRSLRASSLECLKLRTRFRLFSLRDRLRSAAIAGEIPYSELFDYLDTTFTLTIDCLDRINVWEGTALIIYYRNDQELRAAHKWANIEFDRKENRKFSQFYKEYGTEIADFLRARHASIRTGFRVLKAIDVAFSSIARFRSEIVDIFGRAPETSTLKRAHAHARGA